MINNTEFADRLKVIMNYYQLSASGFADKIHVQRSSISHLLSGRNKPSLDFVLKVIKEFSEVELYWLLNGKGVFPSGLTSAPSIEKVKPSIARRKTALDNFIKDDQIAQEDKHRKIDRIVLFYDDGTFKEYIK